jgi:hypothetical protein
MKRRIQQKIFCNNNNALQGDEEGKETKAPVIITILECSSTFSITSSAVDLDPKPLGPSVPNR